MCINKNVPSPKCAQLLNIPKHYISHSSLNHPLETASPWDEDAACRCICNPRGKWLEDESQPAGKLVKLKRTKTMKMRFRQRTILWPTL